jgi:hypothetical protein
MIIETLALGSILYVGFKELKNGFKKDKASLPSETKLNLSG